MNSRIRDIRIYEIHRAHPNWSYQAIGEIFGLSRQRVQQIVHNVKDSVIIEPEMKRIDYRLNGEAVSATQVARETGIPYGVIAMWVKRNLVKVLHHPGHGGRSNPVMLDPVTLQERIDNYRPRQRQNHLAVS